MNAPAWTSALDPAGPQAERIARLFWMFFDVTGVIFVIVMVLLALAVAAGRRRVAHPEEVDVARDRRGGRLVALGVALTVVTLFVFLVSSTWTGRLLASLQVPSARTISVIGHQWWWEIVYEDPMPQRRVITANEIHIPAGQPIAVNVTSRDVIHSFWVPPLHGKRDLIPGYTTTFWLQADQAGTYHGQCAEFCGRQHARMAIDVVAESDHEFADWLDAQREPAREPSSENASRGRDRFMALPCASCHTIAGTIAHGLIGPDLTHAGSRARIASATLPNLPHHLSEWIRNPQSVKPGNQMPPQSVSDEDLRDLVAYLQELR